MTRWGQGHFTAGKMNENSTIQSVVYRLNVERDRPHFPDTGGLDRERSCMVSAGWATGAMAASARRNRFPMTEADLIAVRFPFSTETIAGRAMLDDVVLTRLSASSTNPDYPLARIPTRPLRIWAVQRDVVEQLDASEFDRAPGDSAPLTP
jgi:hypothetical protein